MIGRKLLAIGAATTVILASTIAVPIAGAAPPSGGAGVTWNPDYNAHTITVTVDLTFVSNCPDSLPCRDQAQVAADNIVNDILADWNGHKYKCWPFIVKVNDHVVDSISQETNDSYAIVLNWKMPDGNVLAYTSETGSKAAPGDDEPGDGPRPYNFPNDPAQWPAAGDTANYTHEFGHILGLDDNYDPNAPTGANGALIPVLVPGQSSDAMFAANPATAHLVSEQMIEEAVERSGQVDTSKVKCNMSVDSGPSSINILIAELHGVTVHLYACDYDLPDSDKRKPAKPIHFKGTYSESGSLIIGTAGSISVPVDFNADIPINGGTLSFEVHSNGETLTLSAQVKWGNDGLLVFTEPWEFNGETTAILSPALVGTVSDKASECGP